MGQDIVAFWLFKYSWLMGLRGGRGKCALAGGQCSGSQQLELAQCEAHGTYDS